MVIFRASLGCLLLAALVSCGCGSGGPYRAHGVVKYKGTPVKAGLISFIPEGAQTPAGGAPITDGKYDIPAAAGLPAGKYLVSISVPSGGAAVKEEAPGISGEVKETLPAKYNSKTELRAEVKPGTPNEFDFNLD